MGQPVARVKALRRTLQNYRYFRRGFKYSQAWSARPQSRPLAGETDQDSFGANPLRDHADLAHEGSGLWKWDHYFDIYHRHFSRFVGREPHIVEVGILGGGSLEMWKKYFGDQCTIYGVDIDPRCVSLGHAASRVFIGDQGDRAFWAGFRHEVPLVDIFVDDGGHHPEEQVVTLEEMLPHLRPGGVYVCEDIHGTGNAFVAYAHGLADQLNATLLQPGGAQESRTTSWQQSVHSIHLYPYMMVLEKHHAPPDELRAPKRGGERPQ